VQVLIAEMLMITRKMRHLILKPWKIQ